MAKTKPKQADLPQESLPPKKMKQAASKSAPIPSQPLPPPKKKTGIPSAIPRTGMLPAMELTFDISHGTACNFSFEWTGPPGLRLLSGRIIVALNGIKWLKKATGNSKLVFTIRSAIPTDPGIFEQQTDQLMSGELPKLIRTLQASDSPTAPTVVYPEGIASDDAWVAAEISWDALTTHAERGSVPSGAESKAELGTESQQLRTILNAIQTGPFPSAALRKVATTALKRSSQIALDSVSQASAPQSLLDCLRRLVEDASPQDSAQSEQKKTLQLLLDGLAGKHFDDYETNKETVDLLNAYRKACGLAFYYKTGKNLRKVNLQARPNPGSLHGEFYVVTTTKDHERMGKKPWNIFPRLSVSSS